MSKQRSGLTNNPSVTITEIAGVPLSEFGDTMRIEGVIVGDGHKRRNLYLPGEGDDAAYIEEDEFDIHTMSLDEALAWLYQSDDPTAPLYEEGDDKAKIVKAIVRKSTRQIDQNVAWACYARDNYECKYCGAKNVPLTYDHLIAQAYGGKTTIENGVSSCRPCNKAKGHMTLDNWISYMRKKGMKYGDYWANKAYNH